MRALLRDELGDSMLDEDEKVSKAEMNRRLKEDMPTIFTPGFYPDFYFIDREQAEINLFEVEDTHPLKHEKINRLVWFWFSVDNNLVFDVKLHVSDRYGLNLREIPLPNLYTELFLGISPTDETGKKLADNIGINLKDY